jgi:hypothetical protein
MRFLFSFIALMSFSTFAASDWECFTARWRSISSDKPGLYIVVHVFEDGKERLTHVIPTSADADSKSSVIADGEQVCLKGKVLSNGGGRTFFAYDAQRNAGN